MSVDWRSAAERMNQFANMDPGLRQELNRWQAHPSEYICAGQPMPTEFPTYEQLNLGYDKRYKLGRPAPLDQNRNYQQLRDNYL